MKQTATHEGDCAFFSSAESVFSVGIHYNAIAGAFAGHFPLGRAHPAPELGRFDTTLAPPEAVLKDRFPGLWDVDEDTVDFYIA